MITNRPVEGSNKVPTVLAERYVIGKKLGSGHFGTVYLCKDKEENEKNSQKVLKKIYLNEKKPKETDTAEQEAALLSQLSNPNILKFLDKLIDDECFCIITEYCEGGDLDQYIEKCVRAKNTISVKQTLDWFIQILLGVNYIHSRHILHRDLKSRNIFLKNGIIKIGDFGISRILAGPSDYASTFIGTPYYMSPEVLKHEGYNCKADIWSIGCILFDMCALEHPFTGESFYSIVNKIVKMEPPPLPNRYPEELSNIFNLEAIKHQWLENTTKKRALKAKSKFHFPVSTGGDGDGTVRKTAWMPSRDGPSAQYPAVSVQTSSDSSSDEDEKTITGKHNGSSLPIKPTVYNHDDRPITPLRQTFPSGSDIYKEFEDGIPTNPQLAEEYYTPDFEDDEDEEMTLCNTVNDTCQDREMMLNYLQNALSYPEDQSNTLTTDNSGAFGPEARSNRIRNLRRECKIALGPEMFQNVYKYLWQVRLKKIKETCLNEEEMKGLQKIVKETNYGMMVEQLIFFEEQENPGMFK
ncbi:serine serine/threonine-protein kinase Nek11 isoform X1 [Octopus vulgaris]|uniref:non-specific serine/threonine protein kinase n=1 Tax=Octopus vulgaris TaxID=6645 RepID=A0AA36AU12_OCTVU|nr:serine serine/threonine-protein kinase Nek11 isoform X1 [Octopus vulgaris]